MGTQSTWGRPAEHLQNFSFAYTVESVFVLGSWPNSTLGRDGCVSSSTVFHIFLFRLLFTFSLHSFFCVELFFSRGIFFSYLHSHSLRPHPVHKVRLMRTM